MRVWVVLAAAASLVSGCLGLGERGCGPGDPGLDGAPDLRTPWVDGGYLRTDPSGTWDTVLLQTGEAEAPTARAGPAGWSVDVERISEPSLDNFSLLRVSPGAGQGRLDVAYDHSAACGGGQRGTISWELAAPREGRAAEPGEGVHAYTAGFLEDGTLFYTNIKAIDQDDWPRTDWYAWEGDDPLPVYVYDGDRSEQPAHWKDPQAGTPAEGTVPGLGYYTTIPGFNEALKGLSTNTVRVVRLAPEEAYTRPGNEEHKLYGQALVFYIKVDTVVPLPCPTDTAWACAVAGR